MNKEQTSKNSGKTAIVTGLLSILGTALVAWIGILPQMQKKNKSEIKELTEHVGILLKQNENKCRISGTILQSDGNPLNEVTIFAARADDEAGPDVEGSFIFENMIPETYYNFVILDKLKDTTYRILIDPKDKNVKTDEFILSYTYQIKK